MLANAGALVYSIDVNNILLFSRPFDKVISSTVKTSDHDTCSYDNTGTPVPDMEAEILRSSDLIISAVPGGNYKVKNVPLRVGCGLINVASGDNFDENMRKAAGWYVPRVGAVTRRCLLINALIARVARESGVAVGGQGTRHEER